MFFMHIAFSLALLVIIAGFSLYISAKRHNFGGVKIISTIVLLIALLNIACIFNCALNEWKSGNIYCPMQMSDIDKNKSNNK